MKNVCNLAFYLALIVGMLLSVSAFADTSGVCGDDLTWTLTDDGVLVISGTGEMSSAPWRESYTTRQLIREVILDDGITNICDEAFANCEELDRIYIPDGIKSIGVTAFYRCKKLNNIILPNSLRTISEAAFFECSGLSNVIIPDEVHDIGDFAFYECSGLTDLVIPSGIETIGERAFALCGLSSLTIPATVVNLSGMTLDECTTERYIVDIDNPAYIAEEGIIFSKDRHTLVKYPSMRKNEEYIIPDTVTRIEDYAFKYCFDLERVVMPDDVNYIGIGAFEQCEELVNLKMPSQITKIEDYAFYHCNFKSLVIPSSVTSIGECAFEYQYDLEDLTIGQNVNAISGGAFSNCTGLETIIMYNGITTIEDYAFMNCESLTDIYYCGDEQQWNKTNIGIDNECLTSASIHFVSNVLTLPTRLVTIEHEAFANLPEVDAIEIPATVTSIADDALGDQDLIIMADAGSYAASWAESKGYKVIKRMQQ